MFSAKEFGLLSNTRVIGDALIENVTYDSRNIAINSLFIAIKGENNDGHDFVNSAVKNGAKAVLINKNYYTRFQNLNSCIILADDTLLALYSYVQNKIKNYSVKLFSVTGSCGKTTTKEMLSSIFQIMGDTVKTPGNYNSTFGLPLSMLALNENTKYGVFELGIDKEGEMNKLISLLKPEASIITNIGLSHLKNFKTQDNIAKEKAKSILKQGFVLSENEYLNYFKTVNSNIIEVNNCFSVLENLGLNGYRLKLNKEEFVMPLVGEHNIKDASLAVACAKSYGAKDDEIAFALSNIGQSFGRSRVINKANRVFIEDCYNASSASVMGAINTINNISWSNKKHIVLGDMKELGDKSKSEHEKIGYELLLSKIDNIYLYGDEVKSSYDVLKKFNSNKKIVYTDDFISLSKEVKQTTNNGDLLLLKGSRSMQMERLYNYFEAV